MSAKRHLGPRSIVAVLLAAFVVLLALNLLRLRSSRMATEPPSTPPSTSHEAAVSDIPPPRTGNDAPALSNGGDESVPRRLAEIEPPAPLDPQAPHSPPEPTPLERSIARFRSDASITEGMLLAQKSIVALLKHRGEGEPASPGPMPSYPSFADVALTSGGVRYWISYQEFPEYRDLLAIMAPPSDDGASPASRSQSGSGIRSIPEDLQARLLALAQRAVDQTAR